MKPKTILYIVAAIIMFLAGSLGCLLASQWLNGSLSRGTSLPSINLLDLIPTQTSIPTPTSQATQQPEIPPTATPTQAEPTPVPLELGACEEQVCIRDGLFTLLRPIGGNGRVTIDPSIRFGEFRKNSRYPNLGVEFLNSTGTSVIAAADGIVVVAGNDSQIAYTHQLNEYGNLIIVEHNLVGLDQPIYTLYAHLSDILVQTDDTVRAGQEIGRVGSTGNIRGSVLHFEIRMGVNRYFAVRNPELWLITRQDTNGQPMGALAGRIIDQQGEPVDVREIVLERFDPSGTKIEARAYLRQYGGQSLLEQAPWEESYGMGDLVAGKYKLSFMFHGYQQMLLEIHPGKLTLFTIIQQAANN